VLHLLRGGHFQSGSYAIVHLAVDIMTGRQMACKVLKKKILAERNIYDKIEEEIKILTELKHVRSRYLRF
jgi:serine/threonine protein kinase